MPLLHNIHSIFRNVRRAQNIPETTPAGWMAWPYLDTLFDYSEIVGAGSTLSSPVQANKRVAIVGAGPAGLCAAYELLKVGARPTVYEASSRIGGRLWSETFAGTNVIAEMGAMRVPPSQVTFNIYAKQFGMTAAVGGFPDPGDVQTQLFYENQGYDWTAHTAPPGPFAQISQDFNAWVTSLLTPLYTAWQGGNMSTVQQIWQGYITQFKDMSFYQAVVAGIPQWTTEQLNAFGALGVGSGGFGPLYEISMLELLRIIGQQWEDGQQLFEQGMTALCNGFYTTQVTTPLNPNPVSLQQMASVQFNTPVTRIDYDPNTQKPILWFSSTSAVEFDAVIVATSTRVMETLGLTQKSSTGLDLIPPAARVALRNLHMTNSSKLFIRTANKFWKNQGATFPINIQTDELPRGIYTLDYDSTSNGVVLISYTWEDDSTRLEALDPMTRFQLLKSIINNISPEFANYLVPVNNEVLCIDWQDQPGFLGAFKLNYPGQEPELQAAYYQFMTCLDDTVDTGIYLAGDGVSYSGGWTEGALQTGLNAASAVAYRFGGRLPSYNALQQDPTLYDYGSLPGTLPKKSLPKNAPAQKP